MSLHVAPILPTCKHAARQLWSRVDRSLVRTRYELYSTVAENRPARRALHQHPPVLSTVQRRVVEQLSADGIASTEVTDLGVDPGDWHRLQSHVAQFCASERVREKIAAYPAHLARGAPGSDDYIVKLYPEGPTLTWDDPLLRVGLSAPILDVVSSYLDLWPKLIYLDVWHTIPFDAPSRFGSQAWHRDPEDQRMIKVYLYANEVTAEAGPLEYVIGSHAQGPYGRVWRWRPLAGPRRYPPEPELERRIPTARRMLATGSPGTLIFCDTDGFHRGGISRTQPRIAVTWTFVRPLALRLTARRRFHVVGDPPSWLSEPARFALA